MTTNTVEPVFENLNQTFAQPRRSSSGSLAIKRAFDVLMSSLGLIFLGPLFQAGGPAHLQGPGVHRQ